MAEISNPNYNDQEEHGGTKKCMEVKLSSIQGEYGRKMTLDPFGYSLFCWKLKTEN